MCKECGTGLCVHMRRKSNCADCGTSRCAHGRHKFMCKECGKGYCVHSKINWQCKECAKCSTHLCESLVVVSNGITHGYTWQKVIGGEKPNTGTEIHNIKLAAALQVKVEFTMKELDSFEDNFFYDSFIKVENTYYIPAGTCRACQRGQQITSNNAAANHLRHTIKSQGIVTKPLAQTGARKTKEMKIQKTLDENEIQYVNDKTALDRDSKCEKSLSRPDFQVQHKHQELVTIYVEIDEHQHKTYSSTCELVRLNNILISSQFRRPLVVIRYNPDAFNVGDKRITCKELSRNDKKAIFLRELRHVMDAAANPESFPPLLRVIKIGFDCKCANTTVCGCVHSIDYPDQESLRRDYNLMK